MACLASEGPSSPATLRFQVNRAQFSSNHIRMGGPPFLRPADRQSLQLLPKQQTATAQGDNKVCLFLPPDVCF